MTASLSSFYTSQWDDDQLFEMKHKRNRSKSFNNGALKMGLPDSASDEKANWNEFLIVAQRNHHTVTLMYIWTQGYREQRYISRKSKWFARICYILSFWLILSWNISFWAFITWHILLRSYSRVSFRAQHLSKNLSLQPHYEDDARTLKSLGMSNLCW